jgi:geranylgeranyl pyrophosphate synthase
MTTYDQKISELKGKFDDFFATTVATAYPLEDALHPSVRYALNAGGKRVRPLVCLLVADALGGDDRAALLPALALEMVHTYSLVHDDLPCMDNDDWRRGKPTTHKVYGEATALLAGDALLTDAFAMLTHADSPLPIGRQGLMVRELARAIGGQKFGMVWGQAQDLYWTNRPNGTLNDLNAIHRSKTGALLGASAAIGALAVTDNPEIVAAFRQFGYGIGLVFQIIDDLLDESAATGKSKGKDRDSNKLTYLSLLGREGAEEDARRLTMEAKQIIRNVTDKADYLFQFTDALLARNS